MDYRFSEDSRETNPELMDRIFTEAEIREVYEKIIDRSEYADFEDWMADMLKTGLVTKETDMLEGDADPAAEKKKQNPRTSSLRYCRPEPSPYPLGEHGQYDFYVERLYPDVGKNGSSAIGPVIYIGTGKNAQIFAGIINGEPSDYRDTLLACADMRRSLGIRVMEGEDYLPDNLAVERQALETWTQQKRFLVVTEMRELGYSYDEFQSDSSFSGRKIFKDSSGHPESGDLTFESDEEVLRWILDHPRTGNERIKALYDQLNPETLEAALQERKELHRSAMQDTFWLDEPEPDQSAIFSPITPQRLAGIRR